MSKEDDDLWPDLNCPLPSNPSKAPDPHINRDTSVVMVTVTSAKYHASDKCLIVRVKLPDGSPRTLPIPASTFRYFHGVKYEQAPSLLIDREMYKTEELFNAAARKNRRIKLQLYSEQMNLEKP